MFASKMANPTSLDTYRKLLPQGLLVRGTQPEHMWVRVKIKVRIRDSLIFGKVVSSTFAELPSMCYTSLEVSVGTIFTYTIMYVLLLERIVSCSRFLDFSWNMLQDVPWMFYSCPTCITAMKRREFLAIHICLTRNSMSIFACDILAHSGLNSWLSQGFWSSAESLGSLHQVIKNLQLYLRL